MLLERDAELALVERLVAAARGGSGGCLLVEGPAGIGKSRLAAAAQEAARGAGMRVLAARGTEWERGFAFGVMRQLFEPVLVGAGAGERAELLGGAARLGAAVLELTEAPAVADGGLAGAHGLYWLTANLAERGPLLLAVDDAHWADGPSLRALGYQLRRLADLPALIVLTARTAEPAADPELLAAIRDDALTTVVRPRPLSPAAGARLVRQGLGDGAEDEFCTACHEAAAGNPMLLSALVGALRTAGVAPERAAVDEVWRRAPGIVASFVTPRLRHLPPAAVALARAVALLGDGAELRHAAALARPATGLAPGLAGLTPGLAGLAGTATGQAGPTTGQAGAATGLAGAGLAGPASGLAGPATGPVGPATGQAGAAAGLAGLAAEDAARAADALVAAELLAAGRPLRFTHPLIGQAIHDELTAADRHTGHRRAAELLAAEDASPESVAAHLLEADRLGDAWVVRWLREAARTALAKGAPRAAVAYLRRALVEPPDAGTRPWLLYELGVARARAEPGEAVATLEAALSMAADPRLRASVALELGRVLLEVQDSTRGLPVLERAIAELGGAGEPELRLQLEVELLNAARLDPATRPLAYRRLERLRDAARPDTAAGSALLATTAFKTLQEPGGTARATALARQALGGLSSLDVDDSEAHLQCLLVLTAADELDAAMAACDDAAERARQHGSGVPLAMAMSQRSAVWLRRGALPDAIADARLAHELAAEHDAAFARQFALAVLVIALVERGGLDGAAATVATEPAGEVAYPQLALGRLRAAQGRLDEALRHFLACGVRLELREMHHPGAMPWRADAAVVLHRMGHTAQASTLAAQDVEVATRYRAPSALGVALRTSGLVGGDLGALEEAVRVLRDTPYRAELAHALVEHGAALRRSRRPAVARDPLREALDLAHRCGATLLAERARTELAATGLRPRSPVLTGRDALTASERRVAELAAAGRSNREIAQQLFVTVKTVEVHLGGAYRKLGITGRPELASALSDAIPRPGPPARPATAPRASRTPS